MKCPTCRQPIDIKQDTSFKPFCSKRCSLIDLGDWLSENHSIQDNMSSFQLCDDMDPEDTES